VTNAAPPARDVRLVVGYDGSPPATRALDTAVNLLQGRFGGIEVVYVAHIPTMASLSAGAVAELESDFDDVEKELRTMAGEQLRGEERWGFERRQGLIAEQLLAAAKDTAAAHPDSAVVLVVGSSSLVAHRVLGSVAVTLARHAPVPLVIVP
jgi:nucleotide-binding universal stress UspA family protein